MVNRVSELLHKAYRNVLESLDILAETLEMERSKGGVKPEMENAYAIAINQLLMRISLHSGDLNCSNHQDN